MLYYVNGGVSKHKPKHWHTHRALARTVTVQSSEGARTHRQAGWILRCGWLSTGGRARLSKDQPMGARLAGGAGGEGAHSDTATRLSVCLSTCCKLWPLAVAVCFVATVFCIVNHLTRLFHLPFYHLVFLLILYIFDGPFIPCETTTVCFCRLGWQLTAGKCLMMKILWYRLFRYLTTAVTINSRLHTVHSFSFILNSLSPIANSISNKALYNCWIYFRPTCLYNI